MAWPTVCAATIRAITAGVELPVPIPRSEVVILAVAIILTIQVAGSDRAIEATFKLLTLALVA